MYVEKINFCFPDPQQTKSPHTVLGKKNELLIQVVKEIFQDIHIQIYEIVTPKTGKKKNPKRISVKSSMI